MLGRFETFALRMTQSTGAKGYLRILDQALSPSLLESRCDADNSPIGPLPVLFLQPRAE